MTLPHANTMRWRGSSLDLPLGFTHPRVQSIQNTLTRLGSGLWEGEKNGIRRTRSPGKS